MFFLREARVFEPYKAKVGSNAAGKKWNEVAEKINNYQNFSQHLGTREV